MPRSMTRIALLLLVASWLSGCPSLSERAGLPPSVDRATQLETSGDQLGAARVYEQLAAQNSGAERNEFLLRAGRDYLAAHRAEDATRVLGLTEGTLSPEQHTEHALLSAEAALERGQAQAAARLLGALAAPHAPAPAARYRDLKARIALAAARAPPPPGPEGESGPHIALLLPVTGRAATSAISVRDGFMTAYYQSPAADRPRVRVYDTGTQSVAEALALAQRQGADFIVGPLTREEVVAAADFPGTRAPLLALNFLPAEHVAPQRFYQDALSPEDEARLAARRILEDHHRHGVALVPAGDWGTRVLAAFRQELTAGGGDLIGTAQFDTARTDYSGPIT